MSAEPKIMTTLRALLATKGWNSSEAARQSEIPQSVIYRFMNGGGLAIESVEKLAKCLGLGLLEFSKPDGLKPTRGVKPVKPAPVRVTRNKVGAVTNASSKEIDAESSRRAAKYGKSTNWTKKFNERQAKEAKKKVAKKVAKKRGVASLPSKKVSMAKVAGEAARKEGQACIGRITGSR